MAGVVGVAIGAGVMQFTAPETIAPGWKQQVAAYQSLYVPQTVAAIDATDADLAQQFADAAAAIDLDLQRGVLAGLSGLKLRRAQVLGFQGRDLIQVAFQASDGTPIAFCIIESDADRTDPKIEDLAGLAAASWNTGTHAFLVIGGEDHQAVAALGSVLSSLY